MSGIMIQRLDGDEMAVRLSGFERYAPARRWRYRPELGEQEPRVREFLTLTLLRCGGSCWLPTFEVGVPSAQITTSRPKSKRACALHWLAAASWQPKQ